MIPLVAGALTAAKSAAVSDALQSVSSGLQGLLGDTPLDRERKERAARLLQAALAGNEAAVTQLYRDAFEKKAGLPGDDRPADGKYSPDVVQRLARNALQAYYRQVPSASPWPQYAAALGVPVRAEVAKPLAGLLTPIVDAATDRALERGAERASGAALSLMPYAIAGAVLVAVYFIVTGGKRS